MGITLHLGVSDIPYLQGEDVAEPVRKGKRSGRSKGSTWRRSDLMGGAVTTTGDVATILEEKYHIMQIFAEVHMEDVIVPAVANALEGSLETMLMGGPVEDINYGSALSTIEASFKAFLSNREMETIGYPGVPTAAALRGVNHRMKQPYKRRAPRPSFVDTGLYSANFKAWV